MPVLWICLGLVALLAAVVLIRAIRFVPAERSASREPLRMPECPEAVAEKLSAAIRHPTISLAPDHPERESAMMALHAEIERLFPRFHAVAEKHVINGFSLAYRWKGKTGDNPALIMAHMDVVPIASGTEGDWTYPPFSGAIADGFVWGRGTLDIKSHLICSLEAAEWLLEEGFVPEHDYWFAFGHDEEIGGVDGAMKMAEWFARQGIRFFLAAR